VVCLIRKLFAHLLHDEDGVDQMTCREKRAEIKKKLGGSLVEERPLVSLYGVACFCCHFSLSLPFSHSSVCATESL
jgi:hypothetical protein